MRLKRRDHPLGGPRVASSEVPARRHQRRLSRRGPLLGCELRILVDAHAHRLHSAKGTGTAASATQRPHSHSHGSRPVPSAQRTAQRQRLPVTNCRTSSTSTPVDRRAPLNARSFRGPCRQEPVNQSRVHCSLHRPSTPRCPVTDRLTATERRWQQTVSKGTHVLRQRTDRPSSTVGRTRA